MNVVCLGPVDRRLLCDRVAMYNNSHSEMAGALAERGSVDLLERLRLLRGIERQFMIDLASLCHRFAARESAHPLERAVLGYVAQQRIDADGEQLWVMVDRVRQVRDVVEDGQQPACEPHA